MTVATTPTFADRSFRGQYERRFWRFQKNPAIVTAFNAFSDAEAPSVVGGSVLYTHDSPYRLHLGNGNVPVRMNADGTIRCTIVPGSPDGHSQFRPRYLNDHGRFDPNNSHASCVWLRNYRFEFDCTLVNGGTNWYDLTSTDWVIVFQLWGPLDVGDTPVTPPVSIALDGDAYPEVRWRFHLRGAQASVHSSLDTDVETTRVFAGQGTYRFRVDYRCDVTGATGFCKIDCADPGAGYVRVLDQTNVTTGYNSPTGIGPIPMFGIYTSPTFADANGIICDFDNCFVEELSSE